MESLSLGELSELVPEPSSFSLRSTGKTYRLRAVSLADESWMAKTFGDKLPNVFAEMQMKEICRIAFHLMEGEEKRDFIVREVKFIDDAGNELVEVRGGYELLFFCVQGLDERLAIYKALLQTIGVSRPKLDKLLSDESQKKSIRKKLTGQKSSTCSARSTAGRRNISSAGRYVKSQSAKERS